MKYRGYLSGLKWIGITPFLWSVANKTKIDLKITDREKGLLRETVYFELEGDKYNLNLAKKMIEDVQE